MLRVHYSICISKLILKKYNWKVIILRNLLKQFASALIFYRNSWLIILTDAFWYKSTSYGRQLPEGVDSTPPKFDSVTPTSSTIPYHYHQHHTFIRDYKYSVVKGFCTKWTMRFIGVSPETRDFDKLCFPSRKLFEMSIVIPLLIRTTPSPRLPYTGFHGLYNGWNCIY